VDGFRDMVDGFPFPSEFAIDEGDQINGKPFQVLRVHGPRRFGFDETALLFDRSEAVMDTEVDLGGSDGPVNDRNKAWIDAF
jgi:hypothetical protein